MRTITRIAPLLVAIVLTGGVASAQDQVARPDVNQVAVAAFERRVRADEPVVVIDRGGRTHEGAFRGSSATSISIAANGQTEDIRYADVGRIERTKLHVRVAARFDNEQERRGRNLLFHGAPDLRAFELGA